MRRMDEPALVLVGLAILAGIVGVVVPVLPGLLLSWTAILGWALAEGGAAAWSVLAAATVLFAGSQVLKYVVPGRRMREAGVPWRSLALGSALGTAGFFVVPVAGLVLGFVLGVYVAERARLGSHRSAWESTVHAMKAAGLSILIELAAGLLMGGAWLAAVLAG
jgi:uncharacterized protein